MRTGNITFGPPLPLFDHERELAAAMPVLSPSPEEQREKAMKAAFDYASARFQREYRDFIFEYAETHAEFLAEEITEAYKQDRRRAMPPRDFRACGRIYSELVALGKLKVIGFGYSKHRRVPMPKFARG